MLLAAISSLGASQRLVLFAWSTLVVVFVVVALAAACVKPRWWGPDGFVGWFELAVVGGLGLLPLIANAVSG